VWQGQSASLFIHPSNARLAPLNSHPAHSASVGCKS
jgi:hypothetical protein